MKDENKLYCSIAMGGWAEIGHTGEEQFGAFSYKPGFAINPLKFLIGLAEQTQKSGV